MIHEKNTHTCRPPCTVATAAPGAETADSDKHTHLNNVACIDVAGRTATAGLRLFQRRHGPGLSFGASEVYSAPAQLRVRSKRPTRRRVAPRVVNVRGRQDLAVEFGAKDAGAERRHARRRHGSDEAAARKELHRRAVVRCHAPGATVRVFTRMRGPKPGMSSPANNVSKLPPACCGSRPAKAARSCPTFRCCCT